MVGEQKGQEEMEATFSYISVAPFHASVIWNYVKLGRGFKIIQVNVKALSKASRSDAVFFPHGRFGAILPGIECIHALHACACGFYCVNVPQTTFCSTRRHCFSMPMKPLKKQRRL